MVELRAKVQKFVCDTGDNVADYVDDVVNAENADIPPNADNADKTDNVDDAIKVNNAECE